MQSAKKYTRESFSEFDGPAAFLNSGPMHIEEENKLDYKIPSPETISIMIVEDNQIVSYSLEMALERKKYKVAGIFSSGLEAIEAVRLKRPDLVLMDIMLDGDLDGIQVAQIIQKESAIPVIYLTASGEEKVLERAKGTDHFAFLYKPFKAPELYAAIEVALFRSNMEKELRKSEERYATTLKSIGDAVISFNSVGNVNYINPSALTFLEISEQEALGKKTGDLFEGLKNEKGKNVGIKGILETGKEGIISDLFYPKDSALVAIEMNISFTKDKDGERTGGVIIFRDISRRKEQEIDYANLVVSAQETDRRKISENLHENLAQILAAIRLQFNALENKLEKRGNTEEALVSKLNSLLDTAMEECREISHSLSPRVLEDYGLAAALSDLCNKTQKNTGIKSRFNLGNYSGTEKNREVILFRIAQEMVANVIYHSKAENLKISLDIEENHDHIILKITDDGIGFNKEKYSEASINSGFKNIQNRIVLLKGKSYLRTSFGKGVSFSIEVPS